MKRTILPLLLAAALTGPASGGTSDSGYSSESTGTGRIAFDSNRDGDWEIFVMDADGSNQTQLTKNNSDETYPAWCPVE